MQARCAVDQHRAAEIYRIKTRGAVLRELTDGAARRQLLLVPVSSRPPQAAGEVGLSHWQKRSRSQA
jgi:hypothetical protein